MSQDHPNRGPTHDRVRAVAARFAPAGRGLAVREYGHGNVNDTFLVTVSGPPGGLPDPAEAARFILQRLNPRVFPRPDLVMENLRTFTAHVRRRLAQAPPGPGCRWETPEVRLTRDGQDHIVDESGSFWRALSFIEAAATCDAIKNAGHAREVGYGLGMFHCLLSDLPPEKLADTLPGFHVTPGYLAHYDAVLAGSCASHSPEMDHCRGFIAARRSWASVLEEARERGQLRLRPIHGDPKVNNVMLDAATGRAVSLVDLDTVKPGLVHYDIGDCLRSGCNPLGEETGAWETVRFETDLARAVLDGYLSRARGFLTAPDHAYLFDAIRLLPFELGLRFFTDHLAGNVYFKARHPAHNLARALVQFRLAESLEAQEPAIRAIIRDLS